MKKLLITLSAAVILLLLSPLFVQAIESGLIKIDIITERNSGSGVTIDGILHKDNTVNTTDIYASGNAGVTGTFESTGAVTLNGLTTINDDLVVTGTGVIQSGSPIITDVTTARTLVLADNGAYIRFGSGAASTFTIPTNASVAFPVGAEIAVIQANAGTITFTGSVTLNSDGLKNTLDSQFTAASLKKIDTDTWDLIGRLE